MTYLEQDHCRLCFDAPCDVPHVRANFTETGVTVTSDTHDESGDGAPRITMYLDWEGQGHSHTLELAGDGLRYLAELLARIYGVKLPSDVSDLKREYYAGRSNEEILRARRELIRRGVSIDDLCEDDPEQFSRLERGLPYW